MNVLRFKIVSPHFWIVHFNCRMYSFGTTALLWEIELENHSTEQSLVQRQSRYYCQYNQICIWIFEYCQSIHRYSCLKKKSEPKNIIGRNFFEGVVRYGVIPSTMYTYHTGTAIIDKGTDTLWRLVYFNFIHIVDKMSNLGRTPTIITRQHWYPKSEINVVI